MAAPPEGGSGGIGAGKRNRSSGIGIRVLLDHHVLRLSDVRREKRRAVGILNTHLVTFEPNLWASRSQPGACCSSPTAG
jgi:hypothetical protein